MDSRDLRADVPALHDGTYLNFGAHGPSPSTVVGAAYEFLRRHEYETPVDGGPYGAAFDAFEATRERVASFVGADTDEIALTESTTAGINAVAGALDFESGDVVVRTDLEHPAGTLPWQRLRQEGVEVRVLETDGGRVDREAFKSAVADARLVCFSALTWTHGTVLPVAELVDIAHEAGAFALVDAVQVPGQRPLDVTDWGADAVAAAGHKWLLGLWGGGFLYVDADAAARMEPRTVGYRSVETPTADPYTFSPGARRFEVGSASPAPHVALREAIDVIESVGVDTIRDRIHTLAGRFADGVPDDRIYGPATPESGLVTVDVPDPEATVERLADSNVIVRSLPHPDGVRASIHAVNTAEEIDELTELLAKEW
ncbi:aminotransferase class V-fold PLP-dependent enzyme [Halapricum sp. CBA1109]|uniref:aminotransferase class V-fold PLP-dependent enzyme n=1 Tax=Halapricum sp. CBA1109 TaxID=2668068 RepID=UPI0012FC3085|nr:aminotransferase class V-fold PLP-dependent enzyme [Halapricum sp. CBA1109]MUV88654.1 aminotransferase class V-fold PLP-dependent enzyme [Halapricum sp. CBA1109]